MKKIIFLVFSTAILFAACKKNNSGQPIEAQEFTVNATSSTTWKYFSFEKNDTVTVADPSTSTGWDLAFQRYRIRTNGGRSGGGLGSAANSYKKLQAGFDSLTVVPDTATFAVDDSVEIAVQQGYAKYVLNPRLYSWFTMEFTNTGTQIVPADYTYIVKTATGKYAKVWIRSYYSPLNASGYVTFQYKYQPDGSKTLL
jgi:hypothetical protein